MVTAEAPAMLAVTASAVLQWVGAIAGAVAALAIVFFYRQAREAVRARSLQSAITILDLLDDKDIREIRERVFDQGFQSAITNGFPEDSVATPEGLTAFFRGLGMSWEKVHRYLASLEHISMLIVNDFAPDEIVDMYFGRLLPYQWNVFSPLIIAHRRFYGNKDFLQHLEVAARLLGNKKLSKIIPRRWHWKRRFNFWVRKRELIKQLHSRHDPVWLVNMEQASAPLEAEPEPESEPEPQPELGPEPEPEPADPHPASDGRPPPTPAGPAPSR
jgi:hypothetical protein